MSDRVNEWFAAMVKGLDAQGWHRSIALIDGEHVCVYRNENGMMCPVGIVIPPDAPILKEPKSWTIGVQTLSQRGELGMLGLGELKGREFFFLVEAQRAHDGPGGGQIATITPASMKRSFRSLAEVYHIEPIPSELEEKEEENG